MKGDKSSPLDMAEDRRSWSSLSPESPFSADATTTFRRVLDEFIDFRCGLFSPTTDLPSVND